MTKKIFSSCVLAIATYLLIASTVDTWFLYAQQINTVNLVVDGAHYQAGAVYNWTGPGALAKACAAVPAGATGGTINIPGGYVDTITTLNCPANITLNFVAGTRITVPSTAVINFDSMTAPMNQLFVIQRTVRNIPGSTIQDVGRITITGGTTEIHPEWFGAKCNSPTYDDGVGIQQAIYVAAGVQFGGVVSMPSGRTCYTLSLSQQVIGDVIPYTQKGLRFKGNNSTWVLNPALTQHALFGSAIDTIQQTGFQVHQYDDGTIPLYPFNGNLPVRANQIQLTNPSDCNNFKIGDMIYVKGGYGLATEINAELNKVSGCDPTTGWLYPYWPMAKPYIGPGISPVTWQPNMMYPLGTTTIVGQNVLQVTTAGTSGPTAPVWRVNGNLGQDTQPPPTVGDGAGGILNITGNAICTTTCPTVINTVGSTAGLMNGMYVFGNGVPAGATVASFTTNTVTLSAPIVFSGVNGCPPGGPGVQPGCTATQGALQFYGVPTAVIWTDMGPYGVENVTQHTMQNFEMDDMTCIVNGDGVFSMVQTYSAKWHNVEFRNTLGNQYFVTGLMRGITFDQVKWGAVENHLVPPNFHGSGGQMAYNTVGLEVRDSDLTGQDWQSNPLYCSEYSAQLNVHDSRIGGPGGAGGGFNCFDIRYHHNQLWSNNADNAIGGAGFTIGVCCGSIDIINPIVDDNTFDLTVPATGRLMGLYFGGTGGQFHNNVVHYTSGQTGAAVYIGGYGNGNVVTGNSIFTDADGIYIASGPNIIVKDNDIINTASPSFIGNAPINSNQLTMPFTGSFVVGSGIAAPGIPDGTTMLGYNDVTDIATLSQNTYAALVNVPVVISVPLNSLGVGSAGIMNIVSALQYDAGPNIGGNTIKNFFFGVWVEGTAQGFGGNFQGRLFTPNDMYGVANQYNSIAVSPMNYGPNNSIQFNAAYNPNFVYSMVGRMHLTANGFSLTGPPQDLSESLSLDSLSHNTLGLHAPDGANLFMNFRTPNWWGSLGYGTGGMNQGFSFYTDTAGVMNSHALRFGISSLGARIFSGSYLSIDGSAGITNTLTVGTCVMTLKNGLIVSATGSGCTLTALTQVPPPPPAPLDAPIPPAQ